MRLFGFEHHHQENPFDSAPPWAVELRIMLGLVLKEEGDIMSIQDDLNNSVAALVGGFVALDTSIQSELAAFKEAMANAQSSGDFAALSQAATQAISNIGTVTSRMAADAAALTAAIPAATTIQAPPPPPTPDVPPTVAVPTIDVPTVTAPDAAPPSSS
jgi:hypothetical protein